MAERLYQVIANQRMRGPYPLNTLRDLVRQGEIPKDAQFFHEEAREWKPVSTIVPARIDAPKPQVTKPKPVQTPELSAPRTLVKIQKSRGVFVALGLFGGGLGLHNFYIGRIGVAISQLFATIFVGAMAAATPAGFVFGAGVLIWVIYDLVEVVTDADGDPLR